jgi:quinol monooxygenase YgiN
MLYVRISLMTPHPGHERAVAEIMDDLVSFYAKQPGYVSGYKLAAADGLGDVGRVTIWKSEHDAEAAAQTNHVLSKRSELNELIEEDSHVERSYAAEDESSLLARLIHRLGL